MRNLGVVFSNRLQSFLLCLLGLWMIFLISTMAWQITTSYIAGEGFDASVDMVWNITLILFTPYLFVAGYLLRSLARRIAFYRLLRRQIVIAEYAPPKVLLPVEAGLLVDDDFSLPELAATLQDLKLRGYISIEEHGPELSFALLRKDGLSTPEATFINSLFQTERTLTTHGVDASRRLLAAGRILANAARSELVYGGQLPKSSYASKVLRKAFVVFLGLAAIVQIILTAGIVTAPEQVLSINYPRYPMDISEPVLVIGILAATVAFIIGGFWTRTLSDDDGLKNWRYVAGLKLFLEKVYKGRFYRDGKLTVSPRELRTFYPYAIALGVERDFTRKLERSLLT